MKKHLLLFAMTVIVPVMVTSVDAQIRINIPGLPKAKPTPTPTPTPTPAPKATPEPTSAPVQPRPPRAGEQSISGPPINGQASAGALPTFMTRPVGTDKPVVIKESMDIRADTTQRYWKMPDESNFTSWVPQITFLIRYDSNMRTRLVAEYFNPDGSSWYSEPLNQQLSDGVLKTVEIYSGRDNAKFAKASNMGGTYGVKITDTRDGAVLFEGKFKVTKVKTGNPIPMFKNTYEFVVDNHGVLPVGFISLDFKRDTLSPKMVIGFWMKGEFRGDSLEGRLYRDGNQILTTDEFGEISSTKSRFPNDTEVRRTSTFEYKEVSWSGFRYAGHETSRRSNPRAAFINDSDGDYVFKLFHNGTQVREAAFAIRGGVIVDTGLASKAGLSPFANVIPMTVMGDVENLSPGQIDASFYSNPVPGIGIIVKKGGNKGTK